MTSDPLWDEAKALAEKLLAAAKVEPYAEAHGCNRGMLTPMRMPMGLLHPIDPITDEKGRTLSRYRFLDPVSGPIVTESPQELIAMEVIEFKPMEMPKSLSFWFDDLTKRNPEGEDE